MAVALTDAEIKELFEMAPKTAGSEQLDIAGFVKLVNEAQKAKPMPVYMNLAVNPGKKVNSRIGMGVQQMEGSARQTSSQFENWEIEKKYKRNFEALKNEIEERNNEVLLAKKEVASVNTRVLKLEAEK